MAELVDALASGASERKLVEVQVLFRPPNGTLAEELGKGLQNLVHECESRTCLQNFSGKNVDTPFVTT